MKKILTLLFLILLGGIGHINSQDVLSNRANADKFANSTDLMQEGKQVQGNKAKPSTIQNNHLKFKGVPINGTVNSFVQKLKQKGFKDFFSQKLYQDFLKEKGGYLLKGPFASHNECIILVPKNASKDLAFGVYCVIAPFKRWDDLYNEYIMMKRMLTEKYGEANESVEKWDGCPEPKDDNDRMFEVRMDRCKFSSVFVLNEGTIELRIEHNHFIGSMVSLTYRDAINLQILQQKVMEDL